jgi:folate-binding protein YgfZ
MSNIPLHEYHTAAGASFAVYDDLALPLTYGDTAAEYHAARHGVAVFDRADAGILSLGGETRVDFIQRQTTNDVKRLAPGQATITVLTNPQARILDTLLVLARPNDWLLLNGPPRRSQLASYLRGMIFFMDRVGVRDLNGDFGQIEVLGPQAAAQLAALTGDAALASASLFTWYDVTLAGGELTAARLPGPGGDAWRLIVPAATIGQVWEVLVQAGAQPLGRTVYDALRVESGFPAPGRELNDQVTPLEAGLLAYISESKGCYTGQEIIARQITYDKVTRHLCGLLLDRLPANAAGADVTAGGRVVGSLTTAAMSPALGRPAALAYVKRDVDPGMAVVVRSGEDEIGATITALPMV